MVLQPPELGCSLFGVIMEGVCFNLEPDMWQGCVCWKLEGNDENTKECREERTSSASFSFMKQAICLFFPSSLMYFGEVTQHPTVVNKFLSKNAKTCVRLSFSDVRISCFCQANIRNWLFFELFSEFWTVVQTQKCPSRLWKTVRV